MTMSPAEIRRKFDERILSCTLNGTLPDFLISLRMFDAFGELNTPNAQENFEMIETILDKLDQRIPLTADEKDFLLDHLESLANTHQLPLPQE